MIQFLRGQVKSSNPRHNEIMTAVYDRINNVHKRPLHKGQIKVAQDYFLHGKRVVMSQWSRNGGKTECALFLSNVAALLHDNIQVMIVCPQLKQGKKIYWAKKRLQNYAPPQYIHDVSNTDMKIEFRNGSIVSVEGCENYDGLRGVKPDLVIYDEFQHHSKEFHLEVMEPNLLSKKTALFVFGTPPKQRSAYYVEFRSELLKRIEDGSKTDAYYEFDATINPVNDKEELLKRRKQLIESDNEVIWYREYMGKLMFGGEDSVFPKWNPQNHVRRHEVVMSYLSGDASKLKWYTMCDPGTSTCFAVLFICYNPYTQQVYILDEIYEKDRARTDSRQIWERIRKKEDELYPHGGIRGWHRYYDEQAAWFYNEIAALNKGVRINLSPSQKQKSNEETDISRIKMLMAQHGALTVSDRCYWFRWEVESFVTSVNKDGDVCYVDRNNHEIDNLKYFMQVSGWTLLEKADGSLVPQHNAAKNQPMSVEPAEWADNIVENSLWVNGNDIYDEYFD